MRQILCDVKHMTADPDPVKDAHDKRLLLYISISLTVCTYGMFTFILSQFFREILEKVDQHGVPLWHGILIMLASLLAGRFYYNVKLARQLKSMTPEQRQEEFGDGPALLTQETQRPTTGMSTVASQMSMPEENSPALHIYAVASIFLIAGLVCFYFAIFGTE